MGGVGGCGGEGGDGGDGSIGGRGGIAGGRPVEWQQALQLRQPAADSCAQERKGMTSAQVPLPQAEVRHTRREGISQISLSFHA